MRLISRKGLTSAEALVCHGLALAGLGCTAFVLCTTWLLAEAKVTIGTAWGVLAAAVGVILLGLKQRIGRDEAAPLALRAAWIPNAVLRARAFWDQRQIGAYLTALTVGLFTYEIVRIRGLFARQARRNTVLDATRIVLALPAVVLLFAPYAQSTSPYDVIVGNGLFVRVYILVAAAFFIAIPILLLHFQFLWNDRVTRAEVWTYRGLAVATLVDTWLCGGGDAAELFMGQELRPALNGPQVTLFALVAWVATGTLVLSMKRRIAADEASLMALRIAWIPNAVLTGLDFWGEWERGAYMAAFTLLVFTYEITRQARRHWRPIPNGRPC